jgi:hypothetical protein
VAPARIGSFARKQRHGSFAVLLVLHHRIWPFPLGIKYQRPAIAACHASEAHSTPSPPARATYSWDHCYRDRQSTALATVNRRLLTVVSPSSNRPAAPLIDHPAAIAMTMRLCVCDRVDQCR